jgi:hypothetical protein
VFERPGVRRHGVPAREFKKPRNVKKRHEQVSSRPVLEDEGTYGSIQRITARAQRAILAKGREQSRDREVEDPC